MTKELEEYAIDVIKNHSHKLVKNFTETDLINRELTIFKAGYNKANEWHYVKDGITPTHSYRVLVFTDEGVGFGIYGLDDKKWHTYDTGFEVIA